jgi:hypothetical protein
MKLEPEKREKWDVATAEKKSVLREKKVLKRLAEETKRIRAEIDSLLEKLRMREIGQDPILKDAFAFRKRLEAGDEKFLSAQDSAQWRDSVRRQRDSITKQFEARLKR